MSTNETTPAEGAAPVHTAPAGTTPDSTPVDTTPVVTTPVASTPVASTPVASTPVATAPDDDATSRLRLIVTVIALLGFAALVVVMMFDAEHASETVWTRRVYLLGGVQAIVFASVGWLFGREVHRAEAQTAKADAAQAKEKAQVAEDQAKQWLKKASEETTKGVAIKAAARGLSMAQPAQGTGGPASRSAGSEPPAAGGQTTRTVLLNMVEELWPD